jgi:UDP-2,3-diacylglucosamine pyrophosphatase LpxH
MQLNNRSRIANEARRRIELIASRIPGARALFRPPGAPESTADRLVIISDTHFGNEFAALSTDHALERLVATLAAMGDIDELVLLGDIFDFWTTTVTEAIELSRVTMSELFKLDNVGRMVYIPGNHDHHVVRLRHTELTNKRLRDGDLERGELTVPLTEDCPVLEPVKPEKAQFKAFMTYPWYQVEVRGKAALLTHGHLLGFFERSLWKPRRKFLNAFLLKNNPSVGLDDIEKFVSPYYEMVTLSTEVPGVIDGRYRFYRMVSRTAKLLGFEKDYRVSAYRGTDIEENAVEVEALLDHFCGEMPYYFIYGHSHKPGMLDLPLSGTRAVNTGCWFNDPSSRENIYTIVEVTDDARLIDI